MRKTEVYIEKITDKADVVWYRGVTKTPLDGGGTETAYSDWKQKRSQLPSKYRNANIDNLGRVDYEIGG